MKYQWIFFDLDGTLTDPAVGITGGVMMTGYCVTALTRGL